MTVPEFPSSGVRGQEPIDGSHCYEQSAGRTDVPIDGASDHPVSRALCFLFPDGIGVERYVDADPAIRNGNLQSAAPVKPLAI